MHVAPFVSQFLTKVFWLVVGHFICDYILQGDTVAREKNPLSATELQAAVPWFYWMTAHSLAHGAVVAVVMGSPVWGLAEAVTHFTIDYLKCRKFISIHEDQALHLVVKMVLLLLWVMP